MWTAIVGKRPFQISRYIPWVSCDLQLMDDCGRREIICDPIFSPWQSSGGRPGPYLPTIATHPQKFPMESRKLLIVNIAISIALLQWNIRKSNIFLDLLLTTRGNQKLTQNVTKSKDVRGGIIHVKKVDESQEQKLTRLNKEPADGGRRRIVEQLRVGGWRSIS